MNNPESESIRSFDKLKSGLSAAHMAITSSLTGEQPPEPDQTYPGVVIVPAESFPAYTIDLDSIELDP